MQQLMGKVKGAVRGGAMALLSGTSSSPLVLAPPSRHTCCGESPGACAVALVQWLMDQVGPLLRSLKGPG